MTLYCDGGIVTLFPSLLLLQLLHSSLPPSLQLPYSPIRILSHPFGVESNRRVYLRSSGEVVEGVWTNCFHWSGAGGLSSSSHLY
jgi:hypothetical protein